MDDITSRMVAELNLKDIPTVPECGRASVSDNKVIRQFSTGATRDTAEGKLDYEGFLSPAVLERFAQYMHKHRKQPDGTLRASDNWTKGIPRDVYMKSAFRHFFDWWKEHRKLKTKDGLEDALCALMFNTMGYLHEHLKET